MKTTMEEEEVGEWGRGAKVMTLIEKATNSTAPEVDPLLLRAIKMVVRSSDSELRLAAQTLMDLMKRPHSQVRLLSLLIIDELFMRSKLFRTLITVNLDQLLSLSIGFRRQQPLPAPPAVASVLRTKGIELLEKWNDTFGMHYRHLRLGFDYLKNTLRYQFPNLRANAARAQQERRERELRTQEILQSKFDTLKGNFPLIKDEILSTIQEIQECLEIVRSKDESFPRVDSFDDGEYEVHRNPELQQIRLNSLKEAEKVRESSDNKVLFDTLRELYKLLVTKHLVSVQQWLSLLIRVEVGDDTRFRDTALKELIDIRNSVQAEKRKCEESGCSLPDIRDDEDDVIWEEGKIETIENGESGNDCASTSNSREILNKDTDPDCSIKASEGKVKLNHEDEDGNGNGDGDSTLLRSKLLAEAPVMNWGSFLDNWGSKRDVLANQRGLELDSHWGRVDYDAVIPAEKIAQLNVHATIYEEEQVEIQPCRAPLGNGKLCQRRDLKVCPFHGPITRLDDEGKPIDPPDVAVDAQMEQLAKQAVKNVRGRDKEEVKKREDDKRLLKRAKLAKVREHNEAVLREAALASTSGSGSAATGDYVDTTDLSRATAKAKSKKQTLASMIRKKVTPKDRLAQRLLSARARSRSRDSTIDPVHTGEDMKYREAFPNQW
ncbi:hypothetical protein Dimus_025393 [Dionaea muscipula]